MATTTAIVLFKGDRNPSLQDTITVGGAAYDLTSSSVKLQMRAISSQTLTVDASATVVTAASGIVRYDWAADDVDTAGMFLAWWEITTGSKTQKSDDFLVEIRDQSGTASWLCEISEVREHLQIKSSDRNPDDLLGRLVAAASTAITRYCDREFTPTSAATRIFPVRDCLVDLAPYDLRTVTTMLLHPEESTPTTLTANSDYVLEPLPSVTGTYTRVRLYEALPFHSTFASRFGFARLSIAGAWGMASVPEDVRYAAKQQAATWYRSHVSVYSQAFNPEQGGLDLERPEALSFPVRRLLDPYRRSMV